MGFTSALQAGVIAISFVDLSAPAARMGFPFLFFALSIAHSGVRLGRKTYLEDIAEGDQRTDYVAVSNTVIGVLLLLAGTLTLKVSLDAWTRIFCYVPLLYSVLYSGT